MTATTLDVETTSVLSVTDLIVGVRGVADPLVAGVSFDLRAGEAVGLVGESGSGKTLSVMAAADLLPKGVERRSGSIVLAGTDLDSLGAQVRRRHVTDRVGVVFQNPTASLNPRLTVAAQLTEVVRAHETSGSAAARVRELLELVRIPDADRVLAAYPHELSGGLNQRVAIAMALAASPAVLVADEATTALDVTTQREVLEMLGDLRRDLGLALLLVSHDMGVVADTTDRVLVMRGGEIVEEGRTASLLAAPEHPYTRELLDALPQRLTHDGAGVTPTAADADPILTLRGITVDFAAPGGVRRRARKRVLHGIDLDVEPGRSLGIVGESGSGKTTLARVIAGLQAPSDGELSLGSAGGWNNLRRTDRARWRREVQYVFQDPYGSLNPRLTVAQCIREPLDANPETRGTAADRVRALMDEVHLPVELEHRRTSSLSGGQRQRVGIARSLATNPRVLIGDEPVSALDVTVQARILRLMKDLVARRGMSLLFISHDLAVVSYLCEQVVVVRDGRIVESGPTRELLSSPTTEYTRKLVDAIPGASLPDLLPTFS
ncbi:nickel ABC transporter ATP-binding protein NikE [Rhodococcus sp. NPDC003318]|uniref:nickel ABC transporter ATP-binding protein NikE n=1 Tax=Rhodococcus sp. NPDC003318 TaxID=3364503 RepID=UPI0036AE15BC